MRRGDVLARYVCLCLPVVIEAVGLWDERFARSKHEERQIHSLLTFLEGLALPEFRLRLLALQILFLASLLNLKCPHDRAEQLRKFVLDLRASRHIVHLNTTPFPTNQASLTQNLEVLRKR